MSEPRGTGSRPVLLILEPRGPGPPQDPEQFSHLVNWVYSRGVQTSCLLFKTFLRCKL